MKRSALLEKLASEIRNQRESATSSKSYRKLRFHSRSPLDSVTVARVQFSRRWPPARIACL